MNFFSQNLLAWYDVWARRLPWRASLGQTPNPYHVLLSEFLLQQTTVKAVIPYFHRFIERWPTLHSLAQAPLEEVLKTFAGLGYYRRARHLHACVQHICHAYQAQIPSCPKQLRALPGVGPYIASAVAAIAFNVCTPVVDGNIIRITARLFGLRIAMPQLKRQVDEKVACITPLQRAGDFAQAMMDLGASVCTPQNPRCDICPLQGQCQAYRLNIQNKLPTKPQKLPKPKRVGTAFFIVDGENILLCKRPEQGLLGGMTGLPCTPFYTADKHHQEDLPAELAALHILDWYEVNKTVEHVFTHFHLCLKVRIGQTDGGCQKLEAPYFWHSLKCSQEDSLFDQALPSLMKKALKAGMAALSELGLCSAA